MENGNFLKIIKRIENHSIAIYGLSNHTQEILEQIGDKCNVVGLLDGYKQEGMLYNKRIISLNEALQRKINAIIIVARPSSRRIIVNRIREVCIEHNIKLYDVSGNDLLASHSESKVSYTESGIKREALLEKIDHSDVVSFDIFDTLIMRTLMYPSDVFDLVEQKIVKKYGHGFGFSEKRQAAERELSRTGVPTIYDIYKELEKQVELTCKELEEIQKLEWQVEQQVLIPRHDMCQIFQYAIKKQKRVYLVSDMYYTAAQLIPVLCNLGIKGYEKLIVSCEYGTTKERELFKDLKEMAKANCYLHIGDNFAADVQSAERNGIDGVLVKSSIELFETMYWSETLAQFNSLAERVKLGMFISRMFNSPFTLEKGNIALEMPQDIGYLLFAPILADYSMWLYNMLKEAKKTTILFCARDGFLIKNLLDRLLGRMQEKESGVRTVYFLTSRISAVGASLFQEQDILHVAELDFCGSFGQLLKTRFSLMDEEIAEEDRDAAGTGESILKYKDVILERSKENRKNYLKYIAGLELNGGELAIFDFVSSGTCHAALEKIMNQKMHGYYFIRVEDDYYEKKRLDITSFYDKNVNTCESRIYEEYFILENILTSLMPSLRGFDAEGKPQYLKENRSSEEINFITKVHEGIVQYFEQYLDILENVEYAENRRCSEEILGLLHKIPIENDIFNHMIWEDSFYSRMIGMKELM